MRDDERGGKKKGTECGCDCGMPIITCRSWCEGMETVVEKRGGTGRKRMTGAGEDGERET